MIPSLLVQVSSLTLDARISEAFLIDPNHVLNNSTPPDQNPYGLNPREFKNLHDCCHCVPQHHSDRLEEVVLRKLALEFHLNEALVLKLMVD